MFFGTTPQIVSQFIEKELVRNKPKRAFVLFAGNFVVEQIIGVTLPECEIHSTDTSLYSRAIGFGVTGKDFGLKMHDDVADLFPNINKENNPRADAAKVIFLTEVAPMIKKAEKTPYYKNLLKDAQHNIETYLAKIESKLDKFEGNVKNMKFYGCDACELVQKVKKGDFVFYDPPVLLGDYEKMFAPLEKCYEPNEVPYTQMTDEIKAGHLQMFNDLGVVCYYRTNNPLSKEDTPKGYTEVFRYKYKYSADYCVYTNSPDKTFVGTFEPLKETPKSYKMIDRDDIITEDSKVELIPTTSNISNHYRLLWVRKAEMTNGGHPFLVTVDGNLIGTLHVADSVQFGTELCVIFSDPACPHSRYKRLSKLLLFVLCTKEFLTMFNDAILWEHKGFTTRVFTNEPVSMKYRGMFELTERKEETEGNYKYKLLYQNRDNILPTYKDGLKQWLKKDGLAIHK